MTGSLQLPPLVDPQRTPTISGIASPREFYWVRESPVPFAGMPYPRSDFPWRAVAAAGFRYVVALEPGRYDPSPLSVLSSVRIEDLSHGRDPVDGVGEERLIHAIVGKIAVALRSGHGVIVHCQGGRGRSGTVIGCVLKTLGYRAEDIIPYLDALHKHRGKTGWPESNWQANLIRQWKS
jgi:hypothetical protein